ncbi:hypothetical protein Scep_009669 [Stephania cephalantha]|uniref:Uncharacterized protein n=1 Tax=Stephania cephalantha TaxID=152367 RepID=A0AAP0PCQ3_9MAGN
MRPSSSLRSSSLWALVPLATPISFSTLSGVFSLSLSLSRAELVRRREEHTQATPDQLIDEEQLYYDGAGDCPKWRVYGLRSHARRKMRYEDPSACTSQEPMVRRSEFDAVV